MSAVAIVKSAWWLTTLVIGMQISAAPDYAPDPAFTGTAQSVVVAPMDSPVDMDANELAGFQHRVVVLASSDAPQSSIRWVGEVRGYLLNIIRAPPGVPF